IATCLNVKLLVKGLRSGPLAGAGQAVSDLLRSSGSIESGFCDRRDQIVRLLPPVMIRSPQFNCSTVWATGPQDLPTSARPWIRRTPSSQEAKMQKRRVTCTATVEHA